ncbi:ImmA/IrrE family metallo-endopeptidase [Amycolatopsis sp. NBC_00345]|uniref:hypothetical protein n=1 Tax=Amycolatopsis sp. NBC_00345 TaxID=2975955 RepID=UPI002E26396A
MQGTRRRAAPEVGAAPVTQLAEVERLVSELDLSATTTHAELAAQLSTLRGRPIKIQPYPAAFVAESRRIDEPLPYGVWLPNPGADYVFYRSEATPTHQRHIILHELGHICCRHIGDRTADAGRAEPGEPDHASIANAVKRAGGFAEDQEQAAEAFAYLVERHTRPNLSATGETPAARYRLLED